MDVEELARSARRDEAARLRRRDHWHAAERLVAVEVSDAVLGAVDAEVELHLLGQHVLRGVVRAVGTDVLEVDSNTHAHWVRAGAVVAVTTEQVVRGDDAERGDGSLDILCADLVDTGRRVTVLLSSATSVAGHVVASGTALVLRDLDSSRSTVIDWSAVSALRLD